MLLIHFLDITKQIKNMTAIFNFSILIRTLRFNFFLKFGILLFNFLLVIHFHPFKQMDTEVDSSQRVCFNILYLLKNVGFIYILIAYT